MFHYIKNNVIATVTNKISGEIKQRIEKKNLVVAVGLDTSIQQLLSQTQPAPFQYIAIGGGQDVEWPPPDYILDENHTTLNYELNISRSDPVSDPITFDDIGRGTLTYINNSDDDLWITEAGIFNASGFEAGAMLAKVLLIPKIKKDPEDTFTLIWDITLE